MATKEEMRASALKLGEDALKHLLSARPMHAANEMMCKVGINTGLPAHHMRAHLWAAEALAGCAVGLLSVYEDEECVGLVERLKAALEVGK